VFPVRIKLLQGGDKVPGFLFRAILETAHLGEKVTGAALPSKRAPVLPLAISPHESNRPLVMDQEMPVDYMQTLQNSISDCRKHWYSPLITKH
jgi:hypothetical protein